MDGTADFKSRYLQEIFKNVLFAQPTMIFGRVVKLCRETTLPKDVCRYRDIG